MEIKWFPVELEDWVLHQKCDTFWIIKSNDDCITGYFDNFDKLSDEEADHFLTYRNCYYLKGKPCEGDEELCSCMLKEETGDCIINSISQGRNIENMLYIRVNLLKQIEHLKNRLKNKIKSQSMNGINFG